MAQKIARRGARARAHPEEPPVVAVLTWPYWIAALVTSLYPARFLAGSTLWSTLDAQGHTYRVLAIERAVEQGLWYPRWLSELLFGYGYALLNFYAPLSYYLALALRLLGLSHVGAIEALTAGSFVASSLTMLALARRYLSPIGALVAAVAYTFWPYRLAVVYVRGDIPEALALAILPLVLWSFGRLETARRRRDLTLATVSFASVIWLHNVTALLFAPFLLGFLLVSILAARSKPLMAAQSLALAAGLGISAFFWAPALWETRWLHHDLLVFADYVGSLVSPQALFQPVSWAYHYYPDNGNAEATFPAGFLAALCTLPGVLALFRRDLRRRDRLILVFALAVLLLSLAGMLRALAPVLGLLRLIQAPYRWLGPAGVGAALLTGAGFLCLARSPGWARVALGALAVVVLMASATARLAPPQGDPPRTMDLAALYDYEVYLKSPGTTWTGEFTPVWMSADPVTLYEVRSSGAPGLLSAGRPGPRVEILRWAPLDRTVRVSSTEGFDLLLHAVFVPGWRAFVDGEPAAAGPVGPLGLAGVQVPPGDHAVSFRFGTTTIRLLATFVSAGAALLLLLAPLPRQMRGAWPEHAAHLEQRSGRVETPSPSARGGPPPLALGEAGRAPPRPGEDADHLTGVLGTGALLVGRAVAAGLVLVMAALSSGLWSGVHPTKTADLRPVGAEIGGSAQLVAVDLAGGAVRPGGALEVRLYWLALESTSRNHKVFLHVVDAAGRLVTQADGFPIGGIGRTSGWFPGELLEDAHTIRFPAGAASGEYRLVAGLYDPESGARPAVTALGPGSPVEVLGGNSVVVGQVRVW